MNLEVPWKIVDFHSADIFIQHMLVYGKPIEVSLVGAFDTEGRGSRRDIDLALHRDGDYSKDIAEKHSIDIVALYCIKEGEAKTILEYPEKNNPHEGETNFLVTKELVLKEGQALIFDNKRCRHGRKGKVGERLLLRMWIEQEG